MENAGDGVYRAGVIPACDLVSSENPGLWHWWGLVSVWFLGPVVLWFGGGLVGELAPRGIEDLVVGSGATATLGNKITVHDTGQLIDGTVFDSSYDRGEPFSLTLGTSQVIPGWEQGLQGMKVGGRRKLTIPSYLAYGSSAVGIIPPDSTLVFEVELVSIP